MKKVVIVQKSLVQYREKFFNLLKEALLNEGVDLTLIYGRQNSIEAIKNDQINLEWGKLIPNKTLQIGKRQLIWQPCIQELQGKELVIVEQANKLLLNYYLILCKKYLGIKLAYWGHGLNMMYDSNSLANKFKYLFINKSDWWFAYSQGVKSFLIKKGYPESKITVVQNAIDTRSLTKNYAKIKSSETEEVKTGLGIKGQHIGIFCGAMYPEKQIDFILESCQKIKQQIEDFHMVFIGAGVDAQKVVTAASQNDWIHYVGPKFGEDRIKYFKIASLQLMPGAVGLGVLDSFALATPLISTYQNSHGPEFDYIEHGKNGIITNNNLDDYTNAVVQLLMSKKHIQMIPHCVNSAEKYTIKAMVENFKSGIVNCLNSNPLN